jgi:hypothetical protein
MRVVEAAPRRAASVTASASALSGLESLLGTDLGHRLEHQQAGLGDLAAGGLALIGTRSPISARLSRSATN